MKKLVALFTALMMLVSVLPAVSFAEEADTWEMPEEWADVDTSEHVVITYMTTGDIPTDRTDEVLAKVNELLTEKVNAELEIRWIEWTDYVTNYNLALAVQDGSVDLVGTATDWLDAWPNSQRGAFLALDELLPKYAPKTYASVPQDHWDLCKYNGEIFLMPEDNYAQWTNHGFMYRGDWAKEAGLENGVHSWEELATYFQYVKDNKPDVQPWDANGNGSTYSAQMAGGWQISHTDDVCIEGFPVQIFYVESKDDFTLSRYYLEGDEFVNFAKEMKKWADAGYWRADVLNYTGDVAPEMEEGLTAAHQHHTQTWTGERTTMENKQPGSDLGFFYFGEEMNNVISTNITHGAMAIAAQSDAPERALMVYDLMRNDPEIYRLMMFGFKDEMYTEPEEGYFLRPEGFDSTTDGVTMNFWWGRNDDLELRNAELDWDAIDELYAKYDEFATPYPLGRFVWDSSNVSVQMDNLSNVYNTWMPRIIFGMNDNPEETVQKFRDAMQAAGIEDIMAEVQRQINEAYGL